jgi:hypothetical protein
MFEVLEQTSQEYNGDAPLNTCFGWILRARSFLSLPGAHLRGLNDF